MNYTIPVNLHILIYLNANNSWVISYCKNLKIVQNSSLWILSAPSGVPLHPSPSGLFPASQPWALNSYLLLQLPLGAVSSPLLPATVPTSQGHILGITFHCGLFPHPHTQALPKSPAISLCSASTSVHPAEHPPGTLLAVMPAQALHMAQHRSSPSPAC